MSRKRISKEVATPFLICIRAVFFVFEVIFCFLTTGVGAAGEALDHFVEQLQGSSNADPRALTEGDDKSTGAADEEGNEFVDYHEANPAIPEVVALERTNISAAEGSRRVFTASGVDGENIRGHGESRPPRMSWVPGQKKTWYAVTRGQVPGVYDNWYDTDTQVWGYSRAFQKSFKTREEAQAFYDSEIRMSHSPRKFC